MIPELLSIVAFAALFAIFGVLRLRTGCSSDPSSCSKCSGWCVKRDRTDATRKVH